MSKRIEWIDALKGFAILTVVIGHCTTDSMASHTFLDYTVFIQGIYAFIYSFHMPLFFAVSGYVFFLSRSYRKWKGKVLDFVLIYVIWSALMWLSKYIMSGDVNHPVTLVDLFSIVYKPIMIYWYLYVLIAFYVLFSCLKWKKVSWGLLALTACIALAVKWWQPNIGIASAGLYHLYFFAAGGVIFHKEILRRMKFWHGALLALLLLGNCAFYIQGWTPPQDFAVCKNFIVANVASLLAFYTFSQVKPNRVLLTMGFYTLQIYVMHCFFTGGLRVVMGKLHMGNVYLYFLGGTVLGILIPILFAKICERNDILSVLFHPGGFLKRKQG